MWLHGRRYYEEEAPDSLHEYYADNEFIEPEFSKIDEPWIFESDDENAILDNSQFPYVILPIEVPHEEIYKEAKALLDTGCFTEHRNCSTGWRSVCIHGMSTVHTNVPEDYGLPDEAEDELSTWTDIAKFCPVTVQWMKDHMLYEKFTRVRFMALLPGGWIGTHADRASTVGLGATNVAINNPEGCAMVLEGMGTVPFTPGTAVKLNTGYNHAVWNRSNEPRIHMIFDGDTSKEFKQQVKQGYAKMLGV